MKLLQNTIKIAALLLLASLPANAAYIRVDETGVGASSISSMSGPGIDNLEVYAGVIKLVVDGVAMDGFCIDPFHQSLPSSPDFQYIALENGPKGDQMGAQTALYISRLWGSYYSPDMSDADAAGLQIAIWQLTGGNDFVLNSGYDYGAATFLSVVQSPDYSGPVANLIALTGPGQDYVVAAVPDGASTVTLLGLALCGLAVVARERRSC